MSHELDTFKDGRARMVYVGEKPWHRLGDKADPNVSFEEFMARAGTLFTITLEPIFGPNERLIPGFKSLTRDDTQETLDIVSDKYKPVGNDLFFGAAKEFLNDKSVGLETAGVLRRGRHVWLLCRVQESFAVAGGKDRTDLYLLLTNHFMAGSASSIMLTPTRVVCWNTICMALDGAGRRWTHNHLEAFDAEKAKAALGIGKQGFKKYAEQAEFLCARRMIDEDFVEYVKRVYDLKEPKEEATDKAEQRAAAQRVIDRLKAILPAQPGADMAAGSWWQGFNAVTHDNDHVIGRSPSTRLASAWYGVGAQRKTKALALALEMAK
ncbi:MAG: DUF932 domain-containing protein [Planctomycetaceae bacterium]|nr:MAG: DUF932 domain-containing protein [Planctomycetaceae bacterium]